MNKKIITLALGLIISISLFAQDSYKYAIIPVSFPEIGKGINPYSISTNIQKVLSEKSITNQFQTTETPDDYCEALTVELEKSSSMLKNKLIVKLKNCNNEIVWKEEGVSVSKEYAQGYAEAITDAFKSLKQLPIIDAKTAQRVQFAQAKQTTQIAPKIQTVETPKIAKKTKETAEINETVTAPLPVVKQNTNEEIYKPTNLYYNYSYFTDIQKSSNGSYKIVLINGKSLGYKSNLFDIAVLTPSQKDNGNYSVIWKTTNDKELKGKAFFNAEGLKIDLSEDNTIILKKY